nr:hypothetical protein Itr_chr02CG11640 [Ipomoea trifida]GMC66647.1 hypothetical protein Iba_chr02eCG7670 [Ipomoea batatas]
MQSYSVITTNLRSNFFNFFSLVDSTKNLKYHSSSLEAACVQRYATRGCSFWISVATRRIGEMDCRDEGTTSVSNTSPMEKVVMAVLREGRRVSVDCTPDWSRALGDDVILSLLLLSSLFFV